MKIGAIDHSATEDPYLVNMFMLMSRRVEKKTREFMSTVRVTEYQHFVLVFITSQGIILVSYNLIKMNILMRRCVIMKTLDTL